jgi:hypothetical protein
MRICILIMIVLCCFYQAHSQLLFKQIDAKESGINFQNTLQETPQINLLTYQYFHNGGGVCAGDLNNDGLPDLYFTANLLPNKLYQNKGNWKFQDVSSISNTSGEIGWATGATMIDINNDGLLDIYVCKSGNTSVDGRRNKLYINHGNFKFSEQAKDYGLDDPSYSTQAYFLDFDNDGDLDMYLLNHAISPMKADASNKDLNLPRHPYAGDKLFKNENGKYSDISAKAGIKGSPLGFGLSASIGDVNDDSYPDIYICNDYLERDYLYMNNGDGTFTDRLVEKTKHISNFSMGSDIADVNNDGSLDIIVADMAAADNFRSKTNMSGMNPERFWKYVEHGFHYQYMINTLQLNNGNGTFSESAQLAGVDKTDWSWAPLLADFNHDGLKDLFVTNGLRKEARNNDFVKIKKEFIAKMSKSKDSVYYYMKLILDKMPEQKINNYIFQNNGSLQFIKENHTGFEQPSFSNGAAYADLDNDGDLDLIVNNIDQNVFIYRNDSEPANYIKVKLKGSRTNRSGIGTRIEITSGKLKQTYNHFLTRGYLSSVEDNINIGLGTNSKIELIKVIWPDQRVSILKGIDVNQMIEINHEKSHSSSVKKAKYKPELNTEKVELDYLHKENQFDDFKREVLLPHKMSRLGPALAVGDVNKDGLDDFYVGGAIGQSGGLFIQDNLGEFSLSQEVIWARNIQREEVTATFFDFDQDGDLDLYVGCGGNEYDQGDLNLADQLYKNIGGKFTLFNALPSGLNISTGCVSPLDFDNDGDLDLFVGARQTPGKYPFASNSYLLEFNNDKYTNVSATKAPSLAKLGMVTNSIWEDINGDDKKELILSGEWMPITVLEIVNGTFTNQTKKFGLEQSAGWWFGLACADIDQDGDMDLIGGNLGLNYKYKASASGPFKIYSKDLNEDGKNDIVLGYNQDGETYPLRGRQCSSQQIPTIKTDFPNYNLFASATLKDVYGEGLNQALKMEVRDFNSALFINEDGIFKRKNFPHELQGFNWNDIEVADLNNDGVLDLIIAGNLHESEVETPRGDAGNGLVLFGNGDGTFHKASTTNINWGQHNVKRIEIIKSLNQQMLLIGNNDNQLELLKFVDKK